MNARCTPLDQIHDVTPRTPERCAECLTMGDTWVHLRECLICDHVGCYDSSKNKHATRHFQATGVSPARRLPRDRSAHGEHVPRGGFLRVVYSSRKETGMAAPTELW